MLRVLLLLFKRRLVCNRTGSVSADRLRGVILSCIMVAGGVCSVVVVVAIGSCCGHSDAVFVIVDVSFILSQRPAQSFTDSSHARQMRGNTS
jgi:hypothetical protein